MTVHVRDHFSEDGILVHYSTDYECTPVLANVHFGVPGGNGECLQIGICRVVIDSIPALGPKVSRRCRQASAYFSVNQDGDLEMFFPFAGIMPCTERAIFRNKWFPVPEAYRLPDHILTELPHGTPPVIAVGKYPITKKLDGYTITF